MFVRCGLTNEYSNVRYIRFTPKGPKASEDLGTNIIIRNCVIYVRNEDTWPGVDRGARELQRASKLSALNYSF